MMQKFKGMGFVSRTLESKSVQKRHQSFLLQGNLWITGKNNEGKTPERFAAMKMSMLQASVNI